MEQHYSAPLVPAASQPAGIYHLAATPDLLGHIPEEPGYEEAVTSFSGASPSPPPCNGATGVVEEDMTSFSSTEHSQLDADSTYSKPKLLTFNSTSSDDDPCPLRFGASSDDSLTLRSSTNSSNAQCSQLPSTNSVPRPLQIILESDDDSRPIRLDTEPEEDYCPPLRFVQNSDHSQAYRLNSEPSSDSCGPLQFVAGSDGWKCSPSQPTSTEYGAPRPPHVPAAPPPDLHRHSLPPLVSPNPSSHSPSPAQTSSDNDNNEEESSDLVPQLTTSRGQGQRSRPGVILLGRGNSFSLGRSEVILLHSSRGGPRPPRSQATTPPPPALSTTTNGNDEDCHVNDNNNHIDDALDLDPCGEELERLWLGAEAIMASRCGAVHAVLQDFGVGQGNGEGEEELWGMIQARGSR